MRNTVTGKRIGGQTGQIEAGSESRHRRRTGRRFQVLNRRRRRRSGRSSTSNSRKNSSNRRTTCGLLRRQRANLVSGFLNSAINREQNGKRTPDSWRAFDLNMPAVLRHDMGADSQTQPRALRFRRVERLEQMRHMFRIDTDASIAHGNNDPLLIPLVTT
jgi:hypothetical protein